MYYLLTNEAEHSGRVVEARERDIWTPENPDGWTFQQIGDAHETCVGEYRHSEVAERALGRYLECDPPRRDATATRTIQSDISRPPYRQLTPAAQEAAEARYDLEHAEEDAIDHEYSEETRAL